MITIEMTYELVFVGFRGVKMTNHSPGELMRGKIGLPEPESFELFQEPRAGTETNMPRISS